jgi:hypothetical protein
MSLAMNHLNLPNLMYISDTNGFPANPNYGWKKQYSMENCEQDGGELTYIESYLLDTCLASSTTSIIYSCSMNLSIFYIYILKSDFHSTDDGTLSSKKYTASTTCSSGSVSTDTYSNTCVYYQIAGCSTDPPLGPYDEYGTDFVTQT